MLSPEEYTALLSQDQVAFTEQVFNTVSPGAEYQDNWHIHCLPYDSLIQTEDGLLPIGRIVETQYAGLVASFNHTSNTIEWKKIIQHMINPCAPLVELICSTGEVLKITGNHPVWANGKYIDAEKLQEGDAFLRILPESFSSFTVGEDEILRNDMLREEQGNYKGYCLPDMRGKEALHNNALLAMRQSIKKKWKRISVWSLRQTNIHNSRCLRKDQKNERSFLRPRVLWEACHWLYQYGLHRWQAWRRLSQIWFPTYKKEGFRKGWARLLLVQGASRGAAFRHSSRRQEQDKQRNVESCSPLQEVSQSPERNARRDFAFGKCYVQKITRCIQLPKQTYNFGVEGNNNYFADGILVHNCIIEHLQAVERGEIRRLLINMPPRSMKSISVTIAWTAWLLGKNPSNQIIAASYSQTLSTKHNVDTRLVIQSDWYRAAFPDTMISGDQNEKQKFQTTARGHRIATSVGGSATGEGGDYLIFDDPIKPDEANSETVRGSTNDWLDQVFMTRLNDPNKGKVVGTMQRVHENDPSGHLKRKGHWHELILPAQFTRKTFITIGARTWEKEEGEYMHPSRMGNEVLNQLEKELGAYAFAGQYMQNPAPIGGGEFKTEWIQYYDSYAQNFSAMGMNVYIMYDPANSKKKKENDDPDYTAMVVTGLAKDNNYYILDMVRDRLNPTERIDILFELHKKWNKKSGKPPVVISEQYGMMTDNFFLKKRQDELNYRFAVKEVGGRIKKEDRIRKAIPLFESKRVFLPRKVIYSNIKGETEELVQKFVQEELDVFPVGRHDDLLDAFSRICDTEVRASFPAIETMYLNPGQSLKNYLGGGNSDYMGW